MVQALGVSTRGLRCVAPTPILRTLQELDNREGVPMLGLKCSKSPYYSFEQQAICKP